MDVQKDHVLHSESGKFGPDTTSKPADIPRILGLAASQNPTGGLVLHFHGGLNSQKVGRKIAARLTPVYISAGAYPLFFVWESGLIESIVNNLREIPRDKPFQELVKKVSEWVLKKTGVGVTLRGGTGQIIDEITLREEFDKWFAKERATPPLPEDPTSQQQFTQKSSTLLTEDDLAQEIADTLDNDPHFQKIFEELNNAQAGPTAVVTKGTGSSGVAEQVLVDRRALDAMFPQPVGTPVRTRGVLSWVTVGKFVAKLVIAVLKRYSQERDHGMYCTVVEEVLRAAYLDRLGTTIWNMMKNDTVDSFGDGDECCGMGVVRELGTLAKRGKSFKKITLVGHSTGAINICEFLDAAAKVLPEHKFDIVFLAPAVTDKRFAKALRAHRARIANVRMFGMSDALESEDALVPILYTRSLLYFVSGLLEGEEKDGQWEPEIDAPLVGMKRYVDESKAFGSDFPDVAAVKAYFSEDVKRAVWSESDGGPGLRSHAKKHGDFDDDKSTIESVQTILSDGF